MIRTRKQHHCKKRRSLSARMRRWPAGLKIAFFAVVVEFFNLIVIIAEFFIGLFRK